jgi:beta-galactosidase
VAHSWSGYTGVTVDLTPFARYGDDLNWIAVRADATVREGWWYEGAGIYRHAWLITRPALHIAGDVHGHPVRAADGAWQVPVSVTLGNVADAPAQAGCVPAWRMPEAACCARAVPAPRSWAGPGHRHNDADP